MDNITDSKMQDSLLHLLGSGHKNDSHKKQFTPIVSVNLVKPEKIGSQRNGLSEYLEQSFEINFNVAQYDSNHNHTDDRSFNLDQFNSNSNFKTPIQKQNFNKYLNCNPPKSLSQLMEAKDQSKKKNSTNELKLGRANNTTSIYEDLLLSASNHLQKQKDKSPYFNKDQTVLLDSFYQNQMMIRRASANTQKKLLTKGKKPEFVMSDRTNNQNDWTSKSSIYQEVIIEKASKSIMDTTGSQYTKQNSERMTIEGQNSKKSREEQRKKSVGLSCDNKLHFYNHTEIMKQTSQKVSESRRQLDDEFNQLLKKLDKKGLLPIQRQNYTKSELFKLFKQLDSEIQASEQNCKNSKQKYQFALKDKTDLDKENQMLKKKIEQQNQAIHKFASQNYIKTLEEELKFSNQILKQIRITIGFLLSFYKEIQDAYESPFENELQATISYTLEKFRISEVFTDIDVIQNKISDHEKLLNLEKQEPATNRNLEPPHHHHQQSLHQKIKQDEPKTIPRSKSAAQYKEQNSYAKNYLNKTQRPQQNEPQRERQKSPKVYHQQTLKSENALKKEIDMQKILIKKLKKDQMEKDFYILQLKKTLESDSEKQQIVNQLLEFERQKELLRQDRQQLNHEQENQKNSVAKRQEELDDKTKMVNLLQEKERSLLIEIDELRNLLNNNQSIKQLESSLSQLSGILLSNNSGLKYTDSQMRQLLCVFNFKEQVSRLQTGMRIEFEESGRIIESFMMVIESIKQILPEDPTIENHYQQLRELIFTREKRFKIYEKWKQVQTLPSEISRFEIHNFNTTSKSIFDNMDDQTIFEEVSNISSSHNLMNMQSKMSNSHSINEFMVSDASRKGRKNSSKSRKRSRQTTNNTNLDLNLLV